MHDILVDRSPPSEARWLWIDSISINQDDDEEKNTQVMLMTRIYRNAKLTLVWLGFTENAKLAIEFMAETCKVYFSGDNVTTEIDRINASSDYDDRRAAMGQLFRLSWFSRVWIIQEIAMSQHAIVHVGRCYMGWEEFSSAITFITSFKKTNQLVWETDSQNIGNIVTLRAIRKNIQSSQSFELSYLLSNISNGFHSTDPRDMVFALRGMCSDAGIELLASNYSKSVNFVYEETAIHLLTTIDHIHVLTKAGIGNRRKVHHLPSWVPDWSSKPPRSITKWGWASVAAHLRIHNASPCLVARVETRSKPSLLVIRGTRIDAVQAMVPYSMSIKLDGD